MKYLDLLRIVSDKHSSINKNLTAIYIRTVSKASFLYGEINSIACYAQLNDSVSQI